MQEIGISRKLEKGRKSLKEGVTKKKEIPKSRNSKKFGNQKNQDPVGRFGENYVA